MRRRIQRTKPKISSAAGITRMNSSAQMPPEVIVLLGVVRLTGSMEMASTSSNPAVTAAINSAELSRLEKLAAIS